MNYWGDIWRRELEIRKAMEPYLEVERQARLWREMSPALEILAAQRQAEQIARDALGVPLGLHSHDLAWQIAQETNRAAKVMADAMTYTAKPFSQVAYYADRLVGYERMMQDQTVARSMLWHQGIAQAREEMDRTLSAHRLASELYDLSRLQAINEDGNDNDGDDDGGETDVQQDSTPAVEQKIVLPPGGSMLSWARAIFFLSPKSVELVFEPLVADYRYDHIQALARGTDEKALKAIDRTYCKRFLWALFEEGITQLWNVIKALRSAGK